MAIDSRETLWAELRQRGLIGSTQPERLSGGNLDRADKSKAVFRIVRPDGSLGKVTVGSDLQDLSARSRKWAEVVPAIATVPIFQLRLGETEVLGESYFDGVSLNNAVSQRTFSTGTIHRAFNRVVAALHATLVPSTQVARQTEWDCWCRGILSLPTWSATETTFLQTQLLPALGHELLRGAPNQQWVHGDLTDANLLLNESGDACLIDTEFAHRTHFFGTEAARFHALSISAQKQPGYFSAVLPQPDPAWQIHFWLTQIQREVAANTQEYVVRWLPSRLSFIRQLATLLPEPELDCPWSTATVSMPAPSETVQLFWNSGADIPFNEAASERLNYHHGTVQHVFISVRNRLQPWRIDPSSSDAPSVLHRVSVYSENHTLLGSFAGEELTSLAVSALHDTSLIASSVGLAIQASSGDPQLQISFRDKPTFRDAAWLELELSTDRQARGRLLNPNLREMCRIEEARWLDLAPQKFRISGWYHNSEHAPVRNFSAIIAGERVASTEPLPRPDVQSHFGGAATALLSGFQLDLRSSAANEVVSLLVKHESGEEFYFDSIAMITPPKRAILADDYRLWAEQHDPDPPASDYTVQSKLKFSILLPVYNTDLAHLQQCLSSVRHQHYQNWELCVVDDASTQAVRGVIDEALRIDKRIKFKRRSANGGIARATNDALEMATGDYVVLLDHDDLMRPHALAEFAAQIAEDPKLDSIYSDEDKIDTHGVRTAPLLKPDFSPAFLCGTMFVGHLLCVRTTLARSIGGFDPEYDGVQDYEFFLRLTERTSKIGHLHRILYHWRMSPSSSAMAGNVKGNMDELQLRAVQGHLARMHRPLKALALGGHRIRLQPSELDLTGECTAIFLDASDAKDFETTPVIIAPTRDSLGVLAAAKLATTRFVLVATSAVEPEEKDWLNHLLILAAEKDVGAVGPVLVNQDGRIESSGVVLNSDGQIVPIMHGFARDGEGYNGSLLCTREVMAMAGSCIAIRRETLLEAANTLRFASFENWAVDLCLTLQGTGLRNLVCASAHLKTSPAESAETNDSNDPERDVLLEKWPSAFANPDRFYPASCDRRTGDYRLRTDVSDHRQHEAALEFYIDVPTHFRLRSGYLRMRGWCFSPTNTLRHVRLVFPEFELFGRYGTSRPDVSKVYPQAADTNIGFELWAIIPPGNHSARLQFQDQAGNWLTATTLAVTATRSFFPPWVPIGSGNDLVHFQLGARPSHSPCKVKLEDFPQWKPSTVVLPKISIVTPSYNHRRFLAETLESVVNQTGVDLSYVVQDGGSNDGSIQILEQYADRLSHWESIRDNGQADAIARAFSRTNGEPDDIMAWLNSDDVYLPGTLAFVAGFFAHNPDVDAIYGHRILIDENSLEVGRWFLPAHNDEMLKLNDYVPQETLFWRRRLWDRVGGIDPTFKFAMDWDLLLRFVEAQARIVRVPYFLACFRIHAAQKTSSQIDSLGSEEINRLRIQSQGRLLSPSEVESDPRLLAYLRKSAWIEFLWRRFGVRHP